MSTTRKRILFILAVLCVIFLVIGLSGCEQRAEAIEAQKELVKEWREMPQVENTRYRVSRNILLYDVTLKDGSRCVLVTTGGTYCDFKKE